MNEENNNGFPWYIYLYFAFVIFMMGFMVAEKIYNCGEPVDWSIEEPSWYP